MQQFSISHPDLWATLLPERRRSLILTRERMVLNSVMRAPIIDVLARLPDHPAKQVDDLLPWNWKERQLAANVAA